MLTFLSVYMTLCFIILIYFLSSYFYFSRSNVIIIGRKLRFFKDIYIYIIIYTHKLDGMYDEITTIYNNNNNNIISSRAASYYVLFSILVYI